MENYTVPATKYTPQIEFFCNDNYLRLTGESYPENAMDIFQPLIDRLDEYFAKPDQKLVVDMFVYYLNTSSTKMMYDILGKLQTYHDNGHDVRLTWYYHEGDEDWKESCEMYLEDSSFPYEISELKD